MNRTQKRETQKSTFDKLQALASTKILEQDDFLQVECDDHYEEFKEKVKGMELSHLLRQGLCEHIFDAIFMTDCFKKPWITR